jgi:hypothetical protein
VWPPYSGVNNANLNQMRCDRRGLARVKDAKDNAPWERSKYRGELLRDDVGRTYEHSLVHNERKAPLVTMPRKMQNRRLMAIGLD